MQFDSYRWQDYAPNRYRRGIDLALTGLFALAFSASAALQLTGDGGVTQPAGHRLNQAAMNQAPPACDA